MRPWPQALEEHKKETKIKKEELASFGQAEHSEDCHAGATVQPRTMSDAAECKQHTTHILPRMLQPFTVLHTTMNAVYRALGIEEE